MEVPCVRGSSEFGIIEYSGEVMETQSGASCFLKQLAYLALAEPASSDQENSLLAVSDGHAHIHSERPVQDSLALLRRGEHPRVLTVHILHILEEITSRRKQPAYRSFDLAHALLLPRDPSERLTPVF